MFIGARKSMRQGIAKEELKAIATWAHNIASFTDQNGKSRGWIFKVLHDEVDVDSSASLFYKKNLY